MSDDGACFAPKRYGYGAGLPIRWQGWAVLGGFFGVLGAADLAFASHDGPVSALVVVADVVALLWVTARRTRGGWRWRAGSDR